MHRPRLAQAPPTPQPSFAERLHLQQPWRPPRPLPLIAEDLTAYRITSSRKLVLRWKRNKKVALKPRPCMCTADNPHREPDLAAFLAIKPGIPLAQELEQVLVLVGQIEHHESLARDEEHMHPHEGVEHPACSWSVDTPALVVWKGRAVLWERTADAGLQGGIHQSTDGPHHQQGHDAFRLFEREGGRKKLRLFQEAKPACSPGVPLVSGQHL